MQGSAVGLGVVRPHRRQHPDARRRPRQDHADGRRAPRRRPRSAQALRGNFTFFSGNKQKDGRGAGPFNPPETTCIQDGPSKMYKGEINYVASSSLFLTARGAHVNGPFTLTPKGGLDHGQVFIDTDGVYHNSNTFSGNDRPQVVFNGDGNWFRGKHEVRFGALDAQLQGRPDHALCRRLPRRRARSGRDRRWRSRSARTTRSTAPSTRRLYAGDTLSMDRLTLNGSLRFDRATSSVDAITVPAHPVVPDVLPGVSAPGVKNAVVWNTLSPRAGADLRARRRAARPSRARSYSAFASQLAAPTAGNVSAASFAYAYYLAVDANHNFNIEPNELRRFLFAKNILPDDPTKAVNQIDPNFSAPRTHEVVVGVDRELFPNFARLGVLHLAPLREPAVEPGAADRRDVGRLRRGRPPDRHAARRHALRRALLRAERERRAGGRRHASPRTATATTSTFNGIEIAATKRLKNRWMGRFGFSWNQRARVLRRSVDVDRRSDADHLRPAGQRRPGHGADRGQRQVADLPDAADLPVQRQRLSTRGRGA